MSKPDTLKIELELPDSAIQTIARVAANMVAEDKKEKDSATQAYSVEEVAKMIPSITANTIRKHCKLGIIETSKVGKSYLITKESLNKYLSRNDN